MAVEEIKYLGQEATEQLIQNAKTTAAQKVADHNAATDAHSDIRDSVAEKISYTAQTLTDAQKSQARANIGITGTGADGYTPVRGTDYWTDADKAEIKAYVDEAILGGAW